MLYLKPEFCDLERAHRIMPTLEGILERITYHSEQDGYTVARVQPRGKDHLVTIVGKLLGMQVGESLELEGRWIPGALERVHRALADCRPHECILVATTPRRPM